MSIPITKPQLVEDRFSELFELLNGHTLNGNNATLKDLRKEAISGLQTSGFPTRKTEAWKYTRIEKHLSTEHTVYHENRDQPLSKDDVSRLLISGIDAHVAVTVNGRYYPALSSMDDLEDAVIFKDIKSAFESEDTAFTTQFGQHASHHEDPFVALNTAFLLDGLYLNAPAGVNVSKPIYFLHVFDAADQSVVQPRTVFMAGAESEMVVIEHYVSLNDANHFINVVSESVVERQGSLHHYQIQDLSPSSTAVFNQYAYQNRHSFFSTHTSTLKGGTIRNNLVIVPDAEECESHLLGFVLGTDKMHIDNHTLVDHKMPHCFSNELYKNILDDQSTGVFNGKVLVRQDAQKINAYQSNKSITLTDKARMYSKPELEIYADDVRCSHGATTGQLDAEALFYLRSRGLNEKQARAILLRAFARDVIDAIEIEALREFVDARLVENL